MNATAADPKRGAAWYLEPPFNAPTVVQCKGHPYSGPPIFQNQNWWLDDGDGEAARAIPPEAALYELVRRHPHVKKLFLGQRKPGSEGELFLIYHGRIAWPWLPAAAREEFESLATRKKGRRWRYRDWLEIITGFEGTELGRRFEFGAGNLQGKRRKAIAPRKVNEPARRAFEKACKGAYAALAS